MSLLLTIIAGFSFFILLIIAIYYAVKIREWKESLFFIGAIVVIILVLNKGFNFPFSKNTYLSKGAESKELYFLIVLYIFMLLGMLSQYLFNRFTKPKSERKKFDVGLFFAPMFVSPIVFIPLFAALQNADIDLTGFSAPSIMVFLVSFQNGFMWKEFIDQRLNKKLFKNKK